MAVKRTQTHKLRLTIDKLKAKLTHCFGEKHEVPQVCTQNMRWIIGKLQW